MAIEHYHYPLLKSPGKLTMIFLIKGNIGNVVCYSFGVLKQIVDHAVHHFLVGLELRMVFHDAVFCLATGRAVAPPPSPRWPR